MIERKVGIFKDLFEAALEIFGGVGLEVVVVGKPDLKEQSGEGEKQEKPQGELYKKWHWFYY